MDPHRCELLTLYKPTRVDDLYATVPKPKNAVPKKGLPLWKELPLEKKLPVLGGPKKEMVFTREKIGTTLWQRRKKNEFVLSDPYCQDVSYHYDPLHDENLATFFSRQPNRETLLKLGLITPEGNAVCSLKEYNEYRRYLKRLYLDALNAERIKQDDLVRERQLIQRAREDEERDLKRQARVALRTEKMRTFRAKLISQEQSRQAMLQERMKRTAEKARKVEEMKEEELKRRMERSLALEEKVQTRLQQGRDVERKKMIKTLRKRYEEEKARRKREAKEILRKKVEKEVNEQHHWDQKVKCQLERLDRQKLMLQYHEITMQYLSKMRKKRVESARLRMEDQMMKTKAEHVRSKSFQIWNMKGMISALSKAWEESLDSKTFSELHIDRAAIEKAITLQLAEHKNTGEGHEVLAILQGAKEKLDKMFKLPEPVTFVVDSLLNTTITTYVRKEVERILTHTVAHAEQFKRQHESAVREHERKKNASLRKASMAFDRERHRASVKVSVEVEETPATPQKSTSQLKTRSQTRSSHELSLTAFKPQRLVSFGEISTIDQDDRMLPTSVPEDDAAPLRRTKDRPPTPVPSLTALVDAAFHEPVDMDTVQEVDVEKKDLDRQLKEFSKKLLKVVLYKANTAAEPKRRTLYRQLSNQTLDMNAVIGKVTDTILRSDNANLMEVPEVENISDVLSKELVVRRSSKMYGTTDTTQRPPSPQKTATRKTHKKFHING